ncbi:hypothetical protein WICPIJ_005015 [Wickerhamomyces pijperi]|uniref:RanBD1 domain-containing protein n=1 Tax=Wickerhamomyces pijperi TaxID=599730 RepID=A0A9P8Q4U0_WICPI|nr:hypothetical protein WICPIJ_005015 [Wickerhamomyces pijperi]
MSSKRRAGEQITRENLADFDNESDGAPQAPTRASAEVLAKRKIKMPRSRLNRANANSERPAPSSGFSFNPPKQLSGEQPTNPFAGFGASNTAMKPVSSSPFGQLSSSSKSETKSTTTPSFNFTAPKISQSPGKDNEDAPKANPFGFLKPSAPTPSNQPAITTLFSSANKLDTDSTKTEPSTTKSIKPTKIQALNESFFRKITEQKSKNPVADFTPILKKYIDYYQEIEQEAEPASTTINNTTAPLATEPVKSTFNFGQTTQPSFSLNQSKPAEPIVSFTKPVPTPAPVPATKTAPIEIDSDSDDDIKVEGPTFSLAKPPTTTDSVFKLSKDNKTTNSFGTGPSFTFTATGKKSDSIFKLKPSPAPTPAPAPVQAPVVPEPKKDLAEAASKPAFSFGASTKATTATETPKPAFSFSGLPSRTTTTASATAPTEPSFAFGAQSTEEKKESPASTFGASTSSTTSASDKPAFSFGSNTLSSATSGDKPAFSFGSSSTSTFASSDKPTTTFNFGGSTSTTATAFGGFGSSTTTKTSTDASKPSLDFGSNSATKPSFSFGGASSFSSSTPSSTFNFSLGASKPSEPTTASTETVTGDAESQELEKEADVNFKPVVELKDKVEEKTGEEDETALYTKKSKLMLFQPSNKENPYDSKGLGELKVLKNNSTGKSRVLVRADGSNRVVLNASVNKEFKYDFLAESKKNMVKIPSITAEGKIETYIARVKTAEDGQNLVEALNKAKDE